MLLTLLLLVLAMPVAKGHGAGHQGHGVVPLPLGPGAPPAAPPAVSGTEATQPSATTPADSVLNAAWRGTYEGSCVYPLGIKVTDSADVWETQCLKARA